MTKLRMCSGVIACQDMAGINGECPLCQQANANTFDRQSDALDEVPGLAMQPSSVSAGEWASMYETVLELLFHPHPRFDPGWRSEAGVKFIQSMRDMEWVQNMFVDSIRAAHGLSASLRSDIYTGVCTATLAIAKQFGYKCESRDLTDFSKGHAPCIRAERKLDGGNITGAMLKVVADGYDFDRRKLDGQRQACPDSSTAGALSSQLQSRMRLKFRMRDCNAKLTIAHKRLLIQFACSCGRRA